ncbi:MAG: hypothetical protein O3A95_04835 [Planctomycetota bacterium]|nr:hypothetical protein [Planctomycetota bacterium]MDA1113609.1 hypothetical protein [Planctomycetota bacterium]
MVKFAFVALPSLVLFAAPLAAQWSDDANQNTTVVARAGEQALPKSATTADGSRWVAWFDNASGNYDVYAQLYSATGQATFAPGGVLVSSNPQSSSLVNWDLTADTGGNAVVVFTDTRSGSDLDVYAYCIAATGGLPWGPNGVTLSVNGDFEADPMVTQTSTGDFVVVWSQFSANPVIRMQRLDAGGQPQLQAGGVVIAAEAGASPGFAEVVAGDNGNVIVSWVRDTNFFTSTKHLRTQAFLPSGAPAWAQPTEVYDASNLPFAYSPQLLADDNGGAVLCWHVSNPSRGGLFDAYVQRLDSSGAELFPHLGVPLSNAVGMNHIAPRAAFNARTNSIFAFWSEKNSGQSQSGWFAQQVDANGLTTWGNGIEILPVDSATKYLSYVEPLADGALAVLGWAPNGGFGQDEVIATLVDASGTQVWGGPETVCSLPSNRSTRLSLSMSETEEAVVFWEDERNGNDDIFGQNIFSDGHLGLDHLKQDVNSLSLTPGGTATFSLDAGLAHGIKQYWMLGSNTGRSPGLNQGVNHLFLNAGPYFQLTLRQPGHVLFGAFRGTLDAQGKATATLSFPPNAFLGAAGSTLNHAFVVFGPGGSVDLLSEPQSLSLTP